MNKLLLMAVVMVGCCTRYESPEPDGTISPTGGFPPGIKGKPAPEPLRLKENGPLEDGK